MVRSWAVGAGLLSQRRTRRIDSYHDLGQIGQLSGLRAVTHCKRRGLPRLAPVGVHCYPGVTVASPPEPGRLRHVGRVVDPAVREDGEPEPELTLEGAAEESSAPGPAAPEDGQTARP